MSDPVRKKGKRAGPEAPGPTARRPRGRPRAYDPETALERATRAFWRRGFTGTSLDDLSAAMEMNRPSLYGAFGDKRALYLATLERYVERHHRAMAEILADELPLAAALERVYDGALALYFGGPGSPLGCFLVGTAATQAAADADVRRVLGAGLRTLTRAFERRLEQGRREGELPADASPDLLAELAAAVLFSIALRARAGHSRASLRRFARGAVALQCGGRAR